jgi:hypothetical protein
MSQDAECICGHAASVHQRLPGHPSGAEECYGEPDCECGCYRPSGMGEEP